MAYANLLNITCADKNEFFCRFRDFICRRNGTYDYSATGIGWTLHDSSYATDQNNCAINDYFVIYSGGEGTKDDLYFKISWENGNFRCEGYQSWDATAHAGSTNRYNTTSDNWKVLETGTYILWVYGDLDAIFAMNDLATANQYGVNFGKFTKGWDNQSGTIVTCSDALTAGSDVSITVDEMPANWAVGKEIYIRTTHNNEMSTVKIEKITIKTLANLTITVDLVNSYTVNSALSDFVGYGCQGSIYMFSTTYFLIGENGSRNQSTTPINLALTTSSFDPGEYEDRFYMVEYVYQGSPGLLGKNKLLRKIPSFVSGFAVGDVIVEDDGTEWRCFQAYASKYTAVKEV